MIGKTWGDGEYTGDEVIEAADHTGYTSYSDYFAGDNGLDPDPVEVDSGDAGFGDY